MSELSIAGRPADHALGSGCARDSVAGTADLPDSKDQHEFLDTPVAMASVGEGLGAPQTIGILFPGERG